jgi:hypothetical protein
MTLRRIFVAFVLIFVVAGLFYILSPWAAAFFRYQRLSRYVKIRADYPGCVPGAQAPELLKCQCEFIFEGVGGPGEVKFDGSNIRESYNPETRTYSVSGTGIIRAASSHIDISTDRISINGTELPPDRASFHVLIGSDGGLTNSRVDIAY